MFFISARKISVGFSSKPETEFKSAVEFLLVNPEDLLAPSEPLAKPTFKKLCFLSGVFSCRYMVYFSILIRLKNSGETLKKIPLGVRGDLKLVSIN